MDHNNTFDPMAWAAASNDNQTSANAQNGQPRADQVSNPKPSPLPTGDELEKASAVADELLRLGANIADDYDGYLQLGFALADGLGPEGRDIYHRLCAQSQKYREQDCEKKWRECLSKHDGRTTIASFYKMAQQAGVDLSAISRQFPSNPSVPHHEGNNSHPNSNTTSNASALFPQGEGTEGSEGITMGDDGGGMAGYAETFSDKIDPDNLPPLLHEVVATQSDAEGRDKMLLGALTTFSGAMPGVFGVYDKRRVFPPFYTIIDAPAASDKGQLTACRQLLMPIQQEIEKKNQQAQEDYQQQMAEYVALDKSKRASTTPPQEPPYRSLFIPANSSATAAYQALADNYGWGLTFETEADTLTQALKSDYGDFSSGLRAAFHHEPINYNRRKDKEHVNIYHPRWAVLMTCTPGQLPDLFPSFENGLGSRFVFYNLSRQLFWRNVFEQTHETLDDQFERLGQRYLALFHHLDALKGKSLEFVLSQEQQTEFNRFFSELQLEQVGLLGDDLIACVRRLGLVCFRIAMVLTVLRHEPCQPMFDPLSQTMVCCEQDFRTAMTIVNCLINHTAHVYTNLVRHDETAVGSGSVRLSAQEKRLYDALSAAFTTQDCRQAAEQLGIPWKTAERYIGLFVNKYRLAVRIRNGQYQKTNAS